MRSHSSSRSRSRSHSSSRSRSHSSMSRRSSMHSHMGSRTHSSRISGSRNRSSLGSMRHSSLTSRHHSSLTSRSRISKSGIHSNVFKRHGISNAHAFAVGKSTGVNINGSAMGAHGAALHRSRKIRRNSLNSRSKSLRRQRYFTVNKNKYNTKSTKKSLANKFSTGSGKRHYTLDKNKYGNVDNMGVNFYGENTGGINDSIFIWLIVFFFLIIPIIMFTIFITRMTRF